MRTEQRTAQDQALPQVGHQADWTALIRSISFVEMGRSAAIILNEALIFAHQIFGR
jgi:hypothetical protein